MTKRILIAGGTGLIGTALTPTAKAKGYDVSFLSRSMGEKHIIWDPARHLIDLYQPAFFSAIINLAGSSLAMGRWTEAKKKDIVASRVDSCHTIREYLANGKLQTQLYIGASGVGYYRNSGESSVDESTPTKFKGDFLVDTVIQWEDAHREIKQLGIRTSIMRTGLVLSTEGGALKEILKPGKFGVVPYFGSGQQVWPWIHVDDLAEAFLFIIENENLEDVFIGASPNPSTNKQVAHAINQHLSPKRLMAGVPSLVLKWMLGEMHTALLDSCNAFPRRLLEAGFKFQFPHIEQAMEDLLKKK